jgi:mRNA interferase MazF
VVIVDLGLSGKIRPCVVVSIPNPDRERNMSVVVPLTTEIRGGECEVRFPKPPWLKQDSVVNVLGIAGVDNAKIERRIAPLPPYVLAEIDSAIMRLLGFPRST